MISARLLLTGFLSSSVAAWARQVLTLLLYVVAARVLEPEQIGVFALASAVTLLIEYGVFDSISETVVQRSDLRSEHVGAALSMAAFGGLTSVALGLLLGAWLERLFGVPGLAPILPWMAGGVALICLASVHGGVLRRQARFHLLSTFSVASALIACAAGIFLLLLGWGTWALVAYFFFEKLVLAACMIAGAARQPIGRFYLRHARDLLAYASAILGQRAAFFLRSQMDRLLIAVVWGADVLGAYQLAARVFDSLQAVLLAPASKLFFVGFARLQADLAALRASFLASLEAVAALAFPAFLGLSVVGPEVVRILFGSGWEMSERILQLVAMGGIPLVVSVMSGAVVSAAGAARSFLLVEVATAVAGAALLLGLSQLGGVLWIAAAFVLREGAAVAIYAVALRAILGLRSIHYLRAFLACLGLAAVMFVLATAVRHWAVPTLPTPAALAVVAGAGVAFYVVLLLVARRPLLGRTMALVRGGLARQEKP